MSDAEAFFSDVAHALPFGEVERAEILEELRAHIADSRAELEAEGLASDSAERVAIDRLGQPDRLARALTDARRSRRRLLAAAGAGSWAVASGAIYGWIVGVLLAALAWIATQAMVRFVGPFAFDSVSFVGIGIALYVAGNVVTPVATRAGFRAEAVRRVLALAGALVLAACALVVWTGPLDAVGVVARLTLPVWWIAGISRRSRVGRRSIRTFGGLLLVAIVMTVGIELAQTGLRDIIGKHELSDLLQDREKIASDLQTVLDEHTNPWGITCQSVGIRDIVIPKSLADAMSKQAQAERERKARVILGTAETEISEKFAEASKSYINNPIALQLRAMNMLYEGLKEKGSMIIVPSSALDSMNLGVIGGLASLARGNETAETGRKPN